VVSQCDRDVVLVRQTGRQAGTVRERAAALVVESVHCSPGRWLSLKSKGRTITRR